MAEQQTIRILDPSDSKFYDVVLDESSRALQTGASSSVAVIRDEILGAANNQFTNAEAETIALMAVLVIQSENLFL